MVRSRQLITAGISLYNMFKGFTNIQQQLLPLFIHDLSRWCIYFRSHRQRRSVITDVPSQTIFHSPSGFNCWVGATEGAFSPERHVVSLRLRHTQWTPATHPTPLSRRGNAKVALNHMHPSWLHPAPKIDPAVRMSTGGCNVFLSLVSVPSFSSIAQTHSIHDFPSSSLWYSILSHIAGVLTAHYNNAG